MQFKRLRKLIEDNKGTITNIGITKDKYTKKDYFSHIEFSHGGKIYKIYYSIDKIKGYEYSLGEGTQQNNITIMASNRNYKQIKNMLLYIFS